MTTNTVYSVKWNVHAVIVYVDALQMLMKIFIHHNNGSTATIKRTQNQNQNQNVNV